MSYKQFKRKQTHRSLNENDINGLDIESLKRNKTFLASIRPCDVEREIDEDGIETITIKFNIRAHKGNEMSCLVIKKVEQRFNYEYAYILHDKLGYREKVHINLSEEELLKKIEKVFNDFVDFLFPKDLN